MLLAPWVACREISFGSGKQRLPLKRAFRCTIWVWNRSWVPLNIELNTFFDIGWLLSPECCRALIRRKFLGTDNLQASLDRAQLELSRIRLAAETENLPEMNAADQDLTALLDTVFSGIRDWSSESSAQAQHIDPSRKAASASRAGMSNKGFDDDCPIAALRDLQQVFECANVQFYLVSGTFLGAVREKKFLGHDHDIDLGVMAEDFSEGLLSAIADSGNFIVSEVDTVCHRVIADGGVQYRFMDKPALIRLAHRNGVNIDVFLHFTEGELLWHGSGVHRWNNLHFELSDYEFLGSKFKGAHNFDLYLTENYGADWTRPKTDFNVNFDTPNMTFAGTANALVFFGWAMLKAMKEEDRVTAQRFISLLTELGVVSLDSGELSIVN
jgi:hypothetical protein